MTEYSKAVNRLDKYVAEGRLIRNAWTGTDSRGRKTACLLAALSPKVGAEQSTEACPAEIMPQWFARLTPYIDDGGTETHWPEVVRRYASLARRWHVLDAEAWRRLDYRVRILCVTEAMRYTADKSVLRACCTVIALCGRAADGESVTEGEWQTARKKAARAATGVRAAASAARQAQANAAPTLVARAAASAAAWDRMIDAMLDVIEAAVAAREATAQASSASPRKTRRT